MIWSAVPCHRFSRSGIESLQLIPVANKLSQCSGYDTIRKLDVASTTKMASEISKTQVDRLGDRLKKGNITEADLRLLDLYRRSFTEAYEFVVLKES